MPKPAKQPAKAANPETESAVKQQSKPWQFKPGQSGNPKGRKPGSRNRLSDAFLATLAEDFEKNGKKVIEDVRKEQPAVYLKVVASVVPQQHGLDDRTHASFGSFLKAMQSGAFQPRAFDPDEDKDV